MLLYLQIPLKCLKRKWIFYLTMPPNWALSQNRIGTSWWWTILSFLHFICCPNHYRNPTDRPILCGISGLNEKICQYVDYYLQPFVLQLAWYVGDSSYLISQLSQVTVPDGAIVVTFDVDSLYYHQTWGRHPCSHIFFRQTVGFGISTACPKIVLLDRRYCFYLDRNVDWVSRVF